MSRRQMSVLGYFAGVGVAGEDRFGLVGFCAQQLQEIGEIDSGLIVEFVQSLRRLNRIRLCENPLEIAHCRDNEKNRVENWPRQHPQLAALRSEVAKRGPPSIGKSAKHVENGRVVGPLHLPKYRVGEVLEIIHVGAHEIGKAARLALAQPVVRRRVAAALAQATPPSPTRPTMAPTMV